MAEIRSEEASRLEAVRRRYRAFLTEKHPDVMVVDEYGADDTGSPRREWTLDVDVGGRLARTRGERLTDEADSVFRQMLPAVAAPDLIVHAALLEWGGRGVLCCGRPGAGKSTIAALFPERALCDELARLSVEGSVVEARSLPFWEAIPRRVPLAAIFVLSHGEVNERRALSPSKGVRELRRHLYWPVDDDPATVAIVDTVVTVVERVPVYELAFVPDRSVERWVSPGA